MYWEKLKSVGTVLQVVIHIFLFLLNNFLAIYLLTLVNINILLFFLNVTFILIILSPNNIITP